MIVYFIYLFIFDMLNISSLPKRISLRFHSKPCEYLILFRIYTKGNAGYYCRRRRRRRCLFVSTSNCSTMNNTSSISISIIIIIIISRSSINNSGSSNRRSIGY